MLGILCGLEPKPESPARSKALSSPVPPRTRRRRAISAWELAAQGATRLMSFGISGSLGFFRLPRRNFCRHARGVCQRAVALRRSLGPRARQQNTASQPWQRLWLRNAYRDDSGKKRASSKYRLRNRRYGKPMRRRSRRRNQNPDDRRARRLRRFRDELAASYHSGDCR